MAYNSYNLVDFNKDSVYSEFLSDSYNLQNTITLINNLPFNEQLAKISAGIEYVKHNINQLTSQNCESFFERTSKLDDLYEELRFISVKSQNLVKTLELMKVKLETPYQQLYRQSMLISRLQKACDLLRKMLRIMHLVKRINECTLDTSKSEPAIFLKEILKISQYISEIDLIISSDFEQLSKLNFIKTNLDKIKKIKDKTTEEADLLLSNGLENNDSNLIGTAFQVYHNLNLLTEKFNNLTAKKCNSISQTVVKAFTDFCSKDQFKSLANKDISFVSSIQLANLSNNLRNTLKLCLEVVYKHFYHVTIVIRVLKKKRDNLTQNLLVDLIENKATLMTDFWSEAVKIMSKTFNKYAIENPLLKHLLESDYPKILTIFFELWKRILHDDPDMEKEKQLRSVIAQYESAYLSNSLSSLFERVNKIFSDAKESNRYSNSKVVSVPSEKDIDVVIQEVSNQLSIANVENQLINSVCKNVLKTINLFMVKCEHLASVDGESTQVIGPFTASQRHNALIIHILNYFSNQTENLLKNSSYLEQIQQTIRNSLKALDVLILNIVEPLINSVEDSIEAIILTVHNEQFNIAKEMKPEEVQCSLYMKELQRFISRVSHDYFKQFPESAVIKKRIFQTASSAIDLFLLHNCLLSPVSHPGRVKISADFNQMENVILPLCQRPSDLGRPFQTFKAFQSILFQSPEDISNSPIVGDLVPYYLVVHFLISNYALDELKPPHKYKGWSITRYSQWICEKSSEDQRLALINETLDDYVKQVKRSQKKSFVLIYPLLKEIMRKALSDENP